MKNTVLFMSLVAGFAFFKPASILAQDLAVSEIFVSPEITTACDIGNKDVYVVVRNLSNQAIDFSQNPTNLIMEILHYPSMVSLPFSYPLTGSMSGNTTDTLLMASNINFTPGIHTLNTYLSIPVDNNSSNDTATKILEINPDIAIEILPVTDVNASICVTAYSEVFQEVRITNKGNLDVYDIPVVLEIQDSLVLQTFYDTVRGVLQAGSSISYVFPMKYIAPQAGSYIVVARAELECDVNYSDNEHLIMECVDMNDIAIVSIIFPDTLCCTIDALVNLEVQIENRSVSKTFVNTVVNAIISSDGMNAIWLSDTIPNLPTGLLNYRFASSYIVPVKEYMLTVFVDNVDKYPQNDTIIMLCNPIAVPIPATGIRVFPRNLSLLVGESGELAATVFPVNATNKDFTALSNNPNIASINDSLTVLGNSIGSTYIVFTSDEGAFGDSCRVVVKNGYKTTISGTVSNEDENPLSSGFVSLYLEQERERYILSDATLIESNGMYLFEDVLEGSYIIKATPDSSEDALPTYYGNTEHWRDATPIIVEDTFAIVNKDITVIGLSDPDGISLISGYVGEEENGQKSLSQKTVSRPAENINVYLQSEQNSLWITVAQTLTNVEGYFEFRNVRTGRYRIILDIPGLETGNPQIIDINNGDTIQGIEYGITEDGINNNTHNVGIVETGRAPSLPRVYPNPTTGQLKIECKDGAFPFSTTDFTIFSITGQIVLQGTLQETATINVESLASGMYYLKVLGKMVKFVKN